MMSGAPVPVTLMCMSSLYSELKILHQKEILITEAECGRIGSSGYGRLNEVARIILAKSISESLKFCEICQQYRLLHGDGMNLIKGVSVCDLYDLLQSCTLFHEIVVIICACIT